jgi:hypothetical protein
MRALSSGVSLTTLLTLEPLENSLDMMTIKGISSLIPLVSRLAATELLLCCNSTSICRER